MTDSTHRWAVRDAQRLHSRIMHLVRIDRPPNPEQVAYLRRTTMGLLLDRDTDLPESWIESLRELLGILERFALSFDEEEAA